MKSCASDFAPGVSVDAGRIQSSLAAIEMRGDADAPLVHDRSGEDNFVAEGHGLDRRDVMFGDFVVVGPKSDPADIRNLS